MAARARANPPATDADLEEDGLIEFQEITNSSDARSEEEDSRWLIEHYAELVEQYPMSWVAVQNRRVVGHGATPRQAMDRALRILGEPEGHPEDEEYEAKSGKHGINEPHLYFLERSADRFSEHY